ncbi:hypothetical protein BDK88_3462 [Natrinema hispanicum]|uniref:Uncharacterized protein n=1 Tax=Natrinema hispanicum TaxID=392421 RepID=A0A482Y639_9EURY|nr:hypothetical protein BDK88_3462 [Natrinema hispanicum]
MTRSNGKQRIHLSTEPLTGWVNVEITEKRRTTEWIDQMVELADVHYPDAVMIVKTFVGHVRSPGDG